MKKQFFYAAVAICMAFSGSSYAGPDNIGGKDRDEKSEQGWQTYGYGEQSDYGRDLSDFMTDGGPRTTTSDKEKEQCATEAGCGTPTACALRKDSKYLGCLADVIKKKLEKKKPKTPKKAEVEEDAVDVDTDTDDSENPSSQEGF